MDAEDRVVYSLYIHMHVYICVYIDMYMLGDLGSPLSCPTLGPGVLSTSFNKVYGSIGFYRVI